MTVRKQPAQRLAATGVAVYLPDTSASWTAPRRDHGHTGELTADHADALGPLVELGLEVFDGFVEEFARPVLRRLEPVKVPPPPGSGG